MPTPINIDETAITPTIRSLIADEVKAAIKSPEMRELIAREIARALAPRQPEIYLRVKEAAEILKVHSDTVSRLAREGRLRKVGEGKLLRIPRSSIDRLMTERKATS